MSEREKGQIQCFLCGSQNCVLHYAGSDHSDALMERAFLITDSDYHSFPDIFRCQKCSLIFSDPNSETAAPLPYYQKMVDPDYHHEAEGRAIPFTLILQEIEKFVPTGKILDVGAATGIFLSQAKRRNWEVFGVEPSEWAASEAKERYDISVIPGTLSDAAFQSGELDAIVLLDVLEHVSDPRTLLREIYEILHPQGVLVLTTPNIGSVVARLLGRKWWHVRRAHQYYFNWTTILRLTRETGFRIKKKKYYPWAFSSHYWISRFEHFNKSMYHLLSRYEASHWGQRWSQKVVKLNFFDSFELYLQK